MVPCARYSGAVRDAVAQGLPVVGDANKDSLDACNYYKGYGIGLSPLPLPSSLEGGRDACEPTLASPQVQTAVASAPRMAQIVAKVHVGGDHSDDGNRKSTASGETQAFPSLLVEPTEGMLAPREEREERVVASKSYLRECMSARVSKRQAEKDLVKVTVGA